MLRDPGLGEFSQASPPIFLRDVVADPQQPLTESGPSFCAHKRQRGDVYSLPAQREVERILKENFMAYN